MASNENSCKLKLNEFDEAFSDDVAENTKVTKIFTYFIMKCVTHFNDMRSANDIKLLSVYRFWQAPHDSTNIQDVLKR